MSAPLNIAFIGLGKMGAPMAANLLRSGHKVRGYDLDPQRIALIPGIDRAVSAEECAKGASIVMVSVPGPKQFAAVMEGGLGEAIKPGATLIDLTTNAVDMVRHWGARLANRNIEMLDAPVTGAVDGAISGRLVLFVGGERTSYDLMRPLMNAICSKAIHAGPLGSGNITKLVTNQLWFIHAAAIGEGLMLGKKAGVDLLTLWDAIKSSVGTSFVAEHDVPSIFAGHYDPSFTLDLCVKDLGLIMELSREFGSPAPMTRAAEERFTLARQTYGGRSAELHVAKLIEDEAGADLRAAGSWPSHWAAAPQFVETNLKSQGGTDDSYT